MLLPSAPSKLKYSPDCISGGIAGHMVLPCRDDSDCNDQGTCTKGNCACKAGFTGSLCQFVVRDEGNCTVTEGQCSAGDPAFTNDQPTKSLDECCYECASGLWVCVWAIYPGLGRSKANTNRTRCSGWQKAFRSAPRCPGWWGGTCGRVGGSTRVGSLAGGPGYEGHQLRTR